MLISLALRFWSLFSVVYDSRYVLYRLAKSQEHFSELLEGLIKYCGFIQHRIKEIA